MNKYLKGPKWIENESYKPEYAKYLIEKGVYIRNSEYDYIVQEPDNKEDSSTFQYVIILNEQAYTLSNNIKDKIYNDFERYVSGMYNLRNLDLPFNKILLGLKKCLTKKEQIQFLKDKHSEYMDKVQDKECYLLYSDNIPLFGQSTWKDFVFDCLFNAFEPDIWFIHDYFTLKDIPIKDYLIYELSDWELFYEVKTITDFIAEKIQELETENKEFMLENKETILESEKPNIPKSIAMLYVSGFFDLDKIKKLKPEELHRAVAIIISKNPDNSNYIRAIRGNINVLNPNSNENRLKYTSNNYVEEFKKQITK